MSGRKMFSGMYARCTFVLSCVSFFVLVYKRQSVQVVGSRPGSRRIKVKRTWTTPTFFYCWLRRVMGLAAG